MLKKYIVTYLEKCKNPYIKSPLSDFINKLSISKNILNPLIYVIPEILFSVIHPYSKKYKNLFELWNLSDISSFDSFKKTLICHALSPNGDTIFLLADLGRSLRISASINKKLHIMLADQEWSRYNWVVQDYGDDNLSRNFSFRQKLYNMLGINFDACNLTNVGSFNREYIERLAYEYEDFSKSIFGEKYIKKKLTSKEISYLKDKLKLITVNYHEDLFNLSFFSQKLKAEKEILFISLEYLRSLDKKSFTYYLTQRFHQYKYQNFLKIAVRSEKNFDVPFYELDKIEKTNHGVSHAIYFDDYILNSTDNGEVFVIPYYFPSGSLYQGKKDIKYYQDKVLLLDDYNNQKKFLSKISQMPFPHNARLISDFFSFIHFFLYPLNGQSTNRNLKNEIEVYIKQYSLEFFKSWKYYSRPMKEFSEKIVVFGDYFFSKWPENLPTPYYYFPYIIIEESKDSIKFYELFFTLFNIIIRYIKNV